VIAAEGGYFDGAATPYILMIPGCGLNHGGHGVDRDQDYSELCSHGVGVRKNLHYLCGGCAGGHVVVGGLALEQKIAHASAGQVGLKALLAQGLDDRGGK